MCERGASGGAHQLRSHVLFSSPFLLNTSRGVPKAMASTNAKCSKARLSF